MARKLANIDSLPTLFDESRRPIYAIGSERRIVYCNPALAAWLDMTPSRIVGRVVEYHSELTAADSKDRDAPLTDLCPPPRALAGEPCVGTLSSMGRGGRLVHRLAEFVPLATSRRGAANQDSTSTAQFAVLGLLAEVNLSAHEVATQLSGEPIADELHRTIRHFRRALANSLQTLLGSSAAMQKVLAQEFAAEASDANTLIVGPRGSGRGHVARAIHYGTVRDSGAKLVPVDCELLTDDLLRRTIESVSTRPGEAEHRSTLLLENLERMSAAHQTILSAAIRRAGFPARIIATCSTDTPFVGTRLESAQEKNTDASGDAEGTPTRHPAKPAAGSPAPATIEPTLLDAISIITIRIPPLADRLEDLPILAQYFLESCNRGNDKQVGSLRADALDMLSLYSWPGELVQLREAIIAAHRACKTHEITPADLPTIVHHASQAAMRARRPPERIVLDELLASIEKEVIVRALAQTGGNKSEAAALLGMTRPRLYRRLVQLGLIGEGSDGQADEQPEFVERETTEDRPQ